MFTKLDISAIIAVIAGTASVFIGPFNGVIITLLVFMTCDYISGVVSGAFNHQLSSKRGFKGLLKKLLILLIICIIHTAESRLLGSQDHVLRDSVCAFYIANEGISILENVHECGVKYPEKIEKLFESWRDNNNESNN